MFSSLLAKSAWALGLFTDASISQNDTLNKLMMQELLVLAFRRLLRRIGAALQSGELLFAPTRLGGLVA